MPLLLHDQADRVLDFLLRHPSGSFSVRETARRTDVSPPWVSRTARALAAEGLVDVTEEPTTTKLRASRSDRVRRLRQVLNLHLLYESGLVDALVEAYGGPDAIVLFGSYAAGEDDERSDVDVAVVTRRRRVAFDADSFEHPLGRSINVTEVHPDRMTEEFATVLANGIVLEGFLEVDW